MVIFLFHILTLLSVLSVIWLYHYIFRFHSHFNFIKCRQNYRFYIIIKWQCIFLLKVSSFLYIRLCFFTISAILKNNRKYACLLYTSRYCSHAADKAAYERAGIFRWLWTVTVYHSRSISDPPFHFSLAFDII